MKLLGILIRLVTGQGQSRWKGYLMAAGAAIGCFLIVEHWRQKRARAEVLLRQAERAREKAAQKAVEFEVREAEREVEAARMRVETIDREIYAHRKATKKKLEEIRKGKLLSPETADELAADLGV